MCLPILKRHSQLRNHIPWRRRNRTPSLFWCRLGIQCKWSEIYFCYVFIMSTGPISWQSKKQPTVALSSMEAEYMAKSLATRQINGYDLSLPNSAFLTPELLLSMLTTKAPSITQSTQLITATLNTLTYSIISSMRSSFLTKSKFSTAQPKITSPIYLQKHYRNQGTKI